MIVHANVMYTGINGGSTRCLADKIAPIIIPPPPPLPPLSLIIIDHEYDH